MRIQINRVDRLFYEGVPNYVTFIGYTCPNCDSELYGLWVTKKSKRTFGFLESIQSEDAKKEIQEIVKLSTCPICGGNLYANSFLPKISRTGFRYDFNKYGNKGGFYDIDLKNDYSYYGFSNPTPARKESYLAAIDYLFKEVWQRDHLYELEQEKTKVEEYISSCSATNKTDNKKDPITIKGSPESLKEYIRQLLQLEANIYTLAEHLKELYAREIHVNRAVIQQRFSKVVPYKQKVDDLIAQPIIIEENKIIIPEYPVEPAPPVYKPSNFFNKKRIAMENDVIRKEYEAQKQEFNENVEKHNQAKIQWQNENLRLAREARDRHNKAVEEAQKEYDKAIKDNSKTHSTTAAEMKRLIEDEIQQSERLIKESVQARESLYAINVIFPKYRNPVALSTFYEYLLSGRCDALEGSSGAYNIYEAEIRADRIIDQLDKVIQSLEEIKDNQYMIYQTIRSLNSELSSLNKKMDRAVNVLYSIDSNSSSITSNIDIVAYNTAETAFYAKRNAELSDSLGYMLALK